MTEQCVIEANVCMDSERLARMSTGDFVSVRHCCVSQQEASETNVFSMAGVLIIHSLYILLMLTPVVASNR